MPELIDIDRDVFVHPVLDPAVRDLVARWPLITYVDILVVVDGSISTSPSNSFGVARVIELIRNTKIGCMRFRVDIARRGTGTATVNPSPSPTQPKYSNFRFNMTDGGDHVIDKYEQIWCFGFNPSNSGSANDAEIDQAIRAPTSDAELEKLDEWMSEKKGGLSWTGDHHFLGASMCRRIPRLGTMRRWTNADGVPPIGTPNRIDTLRPPSAAYEPGAPGGPLPMGSFYLGRFRFLRRPHPVLCHPTLGPINVMPDHAHEGWCVENPDLNATKQFNNEPEYPDAIDGGTKPAPKIIAYGSNLSDPPYNFSKGPQPARNNIPMISVYDGHRAGVGRVATDTTWHHWMDVNINQMAIADNDDWKKISRYFQNLAVWLNPPGYSTRCFHLDIVASHFQVVGFQEFHRKASALELGKALRPHLVYKLGPCWVTQWVFDHLILVKAIDFDRFREIEKRLPDVQLDGILLEELVLGHMAQATLKAAEDIKDAVGDLKEIEVKPLPEPERLFAEPTKKAVQEFAEIQQKRCDGERRALETLFG